MIAGTVQKCVALAASTLIVATLLAPSAAATPEDCRPLGPNSAVAPKILPAPRGLPYENKYTTDGPELLSSVDVNALELITPGRLKVATQDDGAPGTCQNSQGVFTGFDNELLRRVAEHFGLRVDFEAVKLQDIIPGVENGKFDLASGTLTAIDSRREHVGFTNGYDFGYNTLVVPTNSTITGFDDLPGRRVGVVESSAQAEYVIRTLKLQPVIFPDFSAAYASLTTRQIDAWVAPERQARGAIKQGDPAKILGSVPLNRFVAWPVANNHPRLIHALNAGLDAAIADGTWAELFQDWVPRPLPDRWKPGSKAAVPPRLRDLAEIARRNAPKAPPAGPSAPSGGGYFAELLKIGLPNTVTLAVGAAPIALVLGMALGLMGSARSRLLRFSARAYTDIVKGLPDVLVVLLIGLFMGGLLGGQTGYVPYLCGIVALGVMAAAYVGEILRAAFQDVEGNPIGNLRHVARGALTPLLNQFIWLLRASALVFFLGLAGSQRELFGIGVGLTQTADNLLPLVAAALCYLALTLPLTYLVAYFDSRRNRDSHELTHERQPPAAESARTPERV